MVDIKSVLRLVRDGIETYAPDYMHGLPKRDYLKQIDAALAQPEQEPVGFETWHKTNYVQSLERYGNTYKNSHVRCRYEGWLGAKAAPPQRTWVGLTDEELNEWTPEIHVVIRSIEAKLKEKNQ